MSSERAKDWKGARSSTYVVATKRGAGPLAGGKSCQAGRKLRAGGWASAVASSAAGGSIGSTEACSLSPSPSALSLSPSACVMRVVDRASGRWPWLASRRGQCSREEMMPRLASTSTTSGKGEGAKGDTGESPKGSLAPKERKPKVAWLPRFHSVGLWQRP